MRDPQPLSLAIAGLFLLLCLPRIAVPGSYLFDEGYYIPAALSLLQGEAVLNREHPMLAKELLAVSIAVLGDNPLGWRALSLVSMTGALFLAMRAMWHFTRDRTASLMFGFLLATSGLTLGLARLGTLDAPMLLFAAAGAHALAKDRRWVAAVFFGLSLACKWTVAPLLPVLALLVGMRGAGGPRAVGIELLRFGIVPLAVYAVSFLPGFFVRENPFVPAEFLTLQSVMKDALLSYNAPNPYAARWWELPLGLAPYWALAQAVDGAWRFIVLIQNPVGTLATLVALPFAWRDRRLRLLLPFYLTPIVLAAGSDRVAYVHQFALPMAVGLAMAALMLARMPRYWTVGTAVASGVVLAFFHPYITAAPFADRGAGERAIWIDRWRIVDFDTWAPVHRPHFDAREKLQAICLQRPVDCDIAMLESPLADLMAEHGLTRAAVAFRTGGAGSRVLALNATPAMRERVRESLRSGFPPSAGGREEWTLSVRRGDFVAVGLFEGIPRDRPAAERRVRSYLVSLEATPGS
ncbi:hypothetical protein [Qipengyuania sp. MTN3-11]|uniref:hypothetical protein n=1 Tax=Qipengyuania sp. MTN3-11 TaxID=3056557 RepID=UPI0036F30C4E